jgi:hypothetical protein
MRKNDYILNPKTGTPVFGTIPEIINKKYSFPEGNIFLRYGEHRGANRGFGANHIWQEHEDDVLSMGYKPGDKISLTAHYVGDILKSGADIYCEFENRRHDRFTILKNPAGVAIIEHREDANNNSIYFVITAFKQGRKTPHGFKIGKLK